MSLLLSAAVHISYYTYNNFLILYMTYISTRNIAKFLQNYQNINEK